MRNDDITNVGLYHTEARVRLATRTQAAVCETSGGAYAQNEIEWTPWLRTMAGRARPTHPASASTALDRGQQRHGAAPVSSARRAASTLGPWQRHRVLRRTPAPASTATTRAATTVTVDQRRQSPVDRVTPLVRAKGAEIGVRTVVIPHLQTTLSLWTLRSRFGAACSSGDAGTTEAEPAERAARRRVGELLRPLPWLVFDGDVSLVARPVHRRSIRSATYVPEAVGTVVSAGATRRQTAHRRSAASGWRYFGPRPLDRGQLGPVEGDEPGQSRRRATSWRKGTQASPSTSSICSTRPTATSTTTTRPGCPGEPADGVDDIHYASDAPANRSRQHRSSGF